MTKNIKIILTVVVVLGAAWFLSGFFFGEEEAPVLTESIDGSVTGVPVEEEGGEGLPAGQAGVTIEEGRAILVLLDELKRISLDETFFTDAIFTSLQDFSVVLTPEPQGRPNPFAPIGIDSTGTIATST